jgi:uncharacterized membrane protein YidH (DUF202 family)
VSTTTGDDGLQQERTTLAWRRTGLALVVAAVVIGRLSMAELGGTAIVLTAFAAAGAAWMAIATLRRSKLSEASSVDSAFDSVLRDGRPPAALAAVTCVLAVVELATVLLS